MGIMRIRPRITARCHLSCLTSAAALIVFLLTGGCATTENPGKKGRGPAGGAAVARAPVQVQPTTVQRMSVQRQVDVAGTLISPDSARVSSEVAGVVREILVELGHDVKPGQVLIRLDPRELQLALT